VESRKRSATIALITEEEEEKMRVRAESGRERRRAYAVGNETERKDVTPEDLKHLTALSHISKEILTSERNYVV